MYLSQHGGKRVVIRCALTLPCNSNEGAAIGICSRVQRESFGMSRRADWSIRYSLAQTFLLALVRG